MNPDWMHKKALFIVDRDASSRRRILWHGCSFLLVLPVYLIATLISPGQRLWFPCKFKELTALPCPTCGFTRSFLWMGHGNYGRAFVTSPLAGILFLAVIFFLSGNLAALLLRVHIKPGPFFRWKKRGWTIFFIGCLALMMADWVYRCMHGIK